MDAKCIYLSEHRFIDLDIARLDSKPGPFKHLHVIAGAKAILMQDPILSPESPLAFTVSNRVGNRDMRVRYGEFVADRNVVATDTA